MSRQPFFNSVPETIVSQGRALASTARDIQILLRKNLSLVKHLKETSKEEEEKRFYDLYLQDKMLNPDADEAELGKEKEKTALLTEKEKLIAKANKFLKDSSESEIEWVLHMMKGTKLKRAAIAP